MKKLWYSWWHFWLGHPKPLRRIDDTYVCTLCGYVAEYGADWGI